MKLLFDEMLAPSLVNRLADLFQDSEHVRSVVFQGVRQVFAGRAVFEAALLGGGRPARAEP